MLFFFTYRKGFMLRALPEKAPFEACFPQKTAQASVCVL
jgi:hypothetical protein